MHILKPGILFSLFFSTFLNTSIAKNKISIDNISSQVGYKVTVCSKVYSNHITIGDKPVTYLNLGDPYPNHLLTIIIFHKDRSNFPVDPSEHYNKKNVCLRSELTLYEERPQIIIKLPSQITIQN